MDGKTMNFDEYIQLPKVNISVWKTLEWLEHEFDTNDLADFIIEALCHNDDVLAKVKKWIDDVAQK